ncbi:hypothetical protein HZS_916 [Henneguya salminicola]|uniref:Protein phosphatase inhibitor 2 (Trinotate prediction) n=1 Tax=Henneguya salminicola TaxID=69463 RepID=A0A6G3MLE3_HENSL|nr:hypothetical protein HZS_916 [Henneguya salminicola]
MSEHTKKPKGILKKSKSSGDKKISGIQWDEENVAATFHPADKDYGHMKINEPLTPYESGSEFDEDSTNTSFDGTLSPQSLTSKLEETKRKIVCVENGHGEDELTPEKQEHKREFERKRKEHYKEYLDVKHARELIEKELPEKNIDKS